jgi:hypothetical protein
MFALLRRRRIRGAIGLIAAYAFVLQAFLAYSMATQAAAHGDLPHAGTFFVLCLTDDSSAAGDGAGPITLKTHCPICTLPPPAMTPDPIALPLWRAIGTQQTPFVTVAACIAFHRARAGLSRAPPLSV